MSKGYAKRVAYIVGTTGATEGGRNPVLIYQGGHMKRLRMEAVLYVQMHDGETQEEAEDRLLDVAESSGIKIVAWWDSQVEDD